MCNMAKAVFYSDEFNKCEGNQRKLYKLIRKLTDGDKTTPYPDSKNDDELCRMFGDFFIDKIDNIMKEVETVIEYENISSIVE